MSQTEKMNTTLGFHVYHIFNIYSEVQCGPMVSLWLTVHKSLKP